MESKSTSKTSYLRINKALNRFKSSGTCEASDEESDLVKEAIDNNLKIHLLTEFSEGFKFIEAKHVKGLMKKAPASDYTYGETPWLSPSELEILADERFEVEGVDWIVTFDDALINEFSEGTCFIPKNVTIEGEELKISKSRWLSYIDRPDNSDGIGNLEYLAAVEVNGVDYFVVKDLTESIFFDDVERTHELNGYTGVKYCLSADIADDSIEENIKVITNDELKTYESNHLPKEVDASNTLKLKTVTSRGLFTNPPKKSGELFLEISAIVDKYCLKENRLPTFEQLWQFLKQEKSFEYDNRKKGFDGISSTTLTRDNLKKSFIRWTKPTR